jgi:hypothetical protein
LSKQPSKLKQQYINVFQRSTDGQAVLKDLMKRAKFFSPITVLGDPHATAYNDGQRTAIIHILQMLDIRDDDLELAQENIKRIKPMA